MCKKLHSWLRPASKKKDISILSRTPMLSRQIRTPIMLTIAPVEASPSRLSRTSMFSSSHVKTLFRHTFLSIASRSILTQAVKKKKTCLSGTSMSTNLHLQDIPLSALSSDCQTTSYQHIPPQANVIKCSQPLSRTSMSTREAQTTHTHTHESPWRA